MTNEQSIKEFREKFEHRPYGVFKDGAHYNPEFTPMTKENVESFLLSLLHQKDLEKEEALAKQKEELKEKLRDIEQDVIKIILGLLK